MSACRGLLVALAVASSTALATDWRAMYSQDSEVFWRNLEALIAQASECSSPPTVKRYLSVSIELKGNAEVSERNAEVIEALAMSNPQCLLSGIELLPVKSQGQIVYFFLLNPLYHEPRVIEEPLERLWSDGKFPGSRKAFLEQKTSDQSIKTDAAR